MPKEIAQINSMLNEWNLLRESARKKSVGLFADSAKMDTINRITQSLNINETMGIDDLIKALQIIETIKIKTSLFAPQFTMGQWLDTNKNRVLKDFKLENSSSVPDISVEKDSAIFRLLAKSHQSLLNMYEVAAARARGDFPVSQVIYSKEQIQTTQAFRDFADTTKELHTSDLSNSANDFKRAGVTIYGAHIRAGDAGSNRDPMIIQNIENFTGDKIDTPHSKANKIFNFGGQFIAANLLHEFSNSTVFTEAKESTISRAGVSAKINWSKNPDSQEIYATVTLNILSFNYCDTTDANAALEFLAIGSDGTTLVPLNDSGLEKIGARNDLERKGITENKVTPVCSYVAKVGLVKDQSGYHLEVQEFTSKFFTDSLVSTKAPSKDDLEYGIVMPRP